MKIKLAILDEDIHYLEKIMYRFQAEYSDKLEIASFRTKEAFEKYLEENTVHIILADEKIEIDIEKVPSKIAFAYLTMLGEVEEIKGKKAICKFQKVDSIYREILNIFSESASEITLKVGAQHSKIYLFSSPKGGSGTSTIAAAFAASLQKEGRKALYLNFEVCGYTGSYFNGAGSTNLSDIIFSVKSKKSNLSLKLESTVKTDLQTKTDYMESCIGAYDFLELTTEEKMQILLEAAGRNNYDTIVVDYDFQITEEFFELIGQSTYWVIVTDGSDNAIKKTERAFEITKIKEAREENGIVDKIRIIYNRFDEKQHKKLNVQGIKEMAVIPRLQTENNQEQIKQIIQEDYFKL